MKKYIALTVLGIAAIWVAWAGGRMAGPGGVANAGNITTQPQGLGTKFAGGWLCYAYLGGPTTPTMLVMTLTSDGTLTIGGAQLLPDGTSISTAHGSWKAVGRDVMAGNFVVLGFKSDMSLGWYEKGPIDLTLSADGNTLDGTLSAGLYAADQDPLGDEEPANGTIHCPFFARRIPAQ